MTEVKLLVNDKDIPLNELMRDMLSNIILGYLISVKNVPEDKKTIKIEIEL